MSNRRTKISLFALLGAILIGFSIWGGVRLYRIPSEFNGERAYQDVTAQVGFGPRTPGSQGHAQAVQYIQQQLKKAGWKAELLETQWNGFAVQNIIASRSDQVPQFILGAHYDTRLQADQDTGASRDEPVPGADDGASGVAVLLELARTLPSDSPPLWLVFFDAEDNGGLDRRDWVMGSSAFAAALTVRPQAVVILDMVGDADLNLFLEANSDPVIANEIWSQAAALGYQEQFIPTVKFSMLDDHTPFLQAGIPAVDIIDFDYPYWHTTADTPDKVSAGSLRAVGSTLWAWIMKQK